MMEKSIILLVSYPPSFGARSFRQPAGSSTRHFVNPQHLLFMTEKELSQTN
jgi:hypothetical protein